MKTFDIYDIDFPYQEDKLKPNPRTKTRPVLILGEDMFVPVAKITGTPREDSKSYEIINWKESGLDKPSYIRFDQKILLSSNQIPQANFRGHLSETDIHNIKSRKLVESLKESIGKELMKINNMFLKEDFIEKNLEKPGTKEYEANSKRQKRINMYRVFANLTADEPITEDNIDQWALERTSAWTNVGIDRIKAEILGQKWSDYEI